jgi:integrase
MNIKKCDCCHSQFRVWSPKVKRYRDVYFCEECRTLAKLLISQDNSSDKLLYKKNDSTYRYAVKRFCKRAGIDTDNISVHSFRKTIADKVDRLKGTSAAQSLLDHKSIVTTQIYLNTGTDKYRNVIDIISNS